MNFLEKLARFRIFFVILPLDIYYKMTSLSIIIPVFNVEKYICTCMESIFRQGLDEDIYEVIIVNDGTKDRSIDVIQDIISQHNNCRVLEQKNQGSWAARNTGLSKASGEYILYLDSDDFLIDGSLKPMLEKALETKIDIILADYLTKNDEEIERMKNEPPAQRPFTVKEKTGEQLFLDDMDPYHCYVWRCLFRREFLMTNHLYFNPEYYFQDDPFLHKTYLMANRCIRTPWLLTVYRKGHESATKSYNPRKVKIFAIAIAKTWELTRHDGLSAKVQNKLREDVYASFSMVTWIISHRIEKDSERIELIDYMKQQVPDLWFPNGLKQKYNSWMYRYFPHLFIRLRYLYAVVFKK